jgi:hypothetical protein
MHATLLTHMPGRQMHVCANAFRETMHG